MTLDRMGSSSEASGCESFQPQRQALGAFRVKVQEV